MDQHPKQPDARLDGARSASHDEAERSDQFWRRVTIGFMAGTVLVVMSPIVLDPILRPPSAPAAQASVPDVRTWRISHHVDPITYDRTAIVSIDADQSEPRSPPTLGIVCIEGREPYVGVEWAKFLGNDSVGDDPKLKDVTVRFGRGEPGRQQWVVMDTDTVTVVPSPVKNLINPVLQVSQLALSLQPYRSGTLTVTFQTAGLAPILAEASTECARIAAQRTGTQGAPR